MTNVTRERKRRSEKLTDLERKAFRQWIGTYETQEDAAEAFGFSRTTLVLVDTRGSGKPETVARVRQLIGPILPTLETKSGIKAA
jgi:DNA-binding XRE family transcriptional regulator